MYKLKKEFLIPKKTYHIDRSYLITILKRFGAEEDSESILLPDAAIKPLEDADISDDVYNFFTYVWSNQEGTVHIEDIIGSHDQRNLKLKTWLQNFIINNVPQSTLETYLSNPKAIFEGKANNIRLFEKNGKYYVADGHHRFSTLYLHYHILKSQNKLPDDFPLIIPSIIRVIPNNIDFIRRFNQFCYENQLYRQDEMGIIPDFDLVGFDPDNPIIRYLDTDILIDQNSNLDEVLDKIKSLPNRKV